VTAPDPTTQPPATAPDEAAVKNKFKTWISEVLDERETKAAAERKAAEEKAAQDAAAAKAANPLNSFLTSLMGKS
jgi:hypothetical protein